MLPRIQPLPSVAPFAVHKLDNTVEGLKQSICDHLRLTLAHQMETATRHDWWVACCLAIRDRTLDKAQASMAAHKEKNVRRLYYFSLEYLMGRVLVNNLWNTGLYDTVKQGLAELGQNLDEVVEEEPDMGLGNGGLGRLAACFLDSLATLDLPSVGYGIHYEFGLFKQQFINGKQAEMADAWTRFGNPWKIVRPEYRVTVPVYGQVEQVFDDKGEAKTVWTGTRNLIGVPWDIPIVGYDSKTINFLRLWESRATQDFDFAIFNAGGYVEAVREKAVGETISKVLYPNDSTEDGKELRLVQQYFFVSCSIADIIKRHFRDPANSWDNFAEKVAIQLNDTHPAVSILELMRVLIDEELFAWEKAWALCQSVFGYTNHTLLPEALEKWSIGLFGKVLPRHLLIAFEINRRFLEEVEKRFPGDEAKLGALSLIEEGGTKMLRMASLSVLGSHSTNGVAALHTRLIKEKLFPEFYQIFPERFNNKTNGITPRRWLKACNPALSALIDQTIGTGWPKHLDELKKLEPFAEQPVFQKKFMAVKRENKVVLAEIIQKLCGVTVSPDALFDVQIKRLHEYKRQHLNLLHILALYRRILQNPGAKVVPRVFIFGAKAAPGYFLAKSIIHAINAAAARINCDERVGDKLKVVFLPNYGVSLAERIIPAADISEQISTAGKEASGTGNMKLALNGAITVGTLDGANVEIAEEVGDDNIFIFGLTVEQVDALLKKGYDPYDYYWQDAELRAVIDWLSSDYFTGNKDDFAPIRQSLLDGRDPYLVLADFRAYSEAQLKVDAAYRDPQGWAKMAILNTARVGKFSSDRTIREYADEVWNLPSVEIN